VIVGKQLADRTAQRILIEIARAGDIEACGAKRFGDQPGIVGGSRLSARLVFAVADDEFSWRARSRASRRAR
jgi:hypothetical protein